MNIVIAEIERLAQVAKDGARQSLINDSESSPTEAQVQESAIIGTFQFEALSNQTALYLLREMFMTQAYRDPSVGGFDSFRSWAYTRLEPYKDKDTLSRLCGVIENIIQPLDAEPVMLEGGELVTGETLIERANPTALTKTYGLFSNAQNGQRETIVSELLTGTSDARKIKRSVGWQPRVGKATAVFTDTGEVDENGEAIYDIHIHATYSQAKLIEKAIDWIVDIQFMPLETP